jgi:hypothetical protein
MMLELNYVSFIENSHHRRRTMQGAYDINKEIFITINQWITKCMDVQKTGLYKPVL